MGNQKGNYHNWVLTQSHAAYGAQPQIFLLEPHAVFTPPEGPHTAGMTLERGNAAQEELLHHLGAVTPSALRFAKRCQMKTSRELVSVSWPQP